MRTTVHFPLSPHKSQQNPIYLLMGDDLILDDLRLVINVASADVVWGEEKALTLYVMLNAGPSRAAASSFTESGTGEQKIVIIS